LPKYEEEDGVKILRIQGFFQRIPFLYKDPAKRFHPPAQDWLISKKLAETIEQEKPDVIHAHGWILYSVLPLKERFGIPLVTTLHDYALLCPTKTLMNKNAICDEPLTRDCIACGRDSYGLVKSIAAYVATRKCKKKLKLVDKFIAVSSFVKEVYCKHLGLSQEDVEMIPNFYDADIEKQWKEAALDLPKDFILFVGTASAHKGINILLEAYQKFSPQTKLVLIGSTHPDYRYKSTEGILVVENAPHNVVMQAMSRCRFAVFPSIWPEPFGIVAIEAMSQSKAVIASDIGGLKDIVLDGETGLLVPPNDSNKLAQAISHLLERPETASEMGERGYERFMEHYTPDVVIPRIVDVYESLV
jgi:glycosyltransferase involved in cell wall biosynthesis